MTFPAAVPDRTKVLLPVPIAQNPAEPTPMEWAEMLESRLLAQREHACYYDAYYSGERRLQLVAQLYQDVFGTGAGELLLQPPDVNIAAVGVDALAERLVIEGFRVGDDDNQVGAAEARRIFLGNDLDVMQAIAHTETFAKGTVALLAWPGENDDPVISAEDAEQFVVHRSASPPYNVDAAFKVYIDEWTGLERAFLWLESGRYHLERTGGDIPSRSENVPKADLAGMLGWSLVDTDPTPLPIAGQVPVAELANRARLLRPPASELVAVAPLADAHTLLMADMIVAADTGAFPIRTATGVTLVRNPDGTVQTPFDVRADKAMVSENPNAKYGSLPPSDLAGYVSGIDLILRLFRTVTRVPQHYFGEGSSSGTSGETLKAAEASLVRRADGMTTRLVGWRQIMHTALVIKDPATYKRMPVQTNWANTETRIFAQEADAAAKFAQMGVPLEIVLEEIGFKPETIQRALQLQKQQGLTGAKLLQAAQAAAGAVPVGAPAPIVPAA